MKCTKAAIRRTMTAIVFVVPIVFVAAVAANASQDRAIPGARNQSAGTACLAKPTLSERLEFATLEQARRILGRPDDWARQLSVFDRGARMRTLEPATTQELLQYLSSTARAWAPAEEAYWSVLAGQLSDALAGLNLRVPRAFMVKSSGRDENNAVYVRNRSIVLPEERLQIAGDMRRDFFLLAHELFHLLSAESPALRHALYGLLGFERFAKFEYPLELEERRLSNPGAHSYDHALAVETPDGPADVVPVIQSRIKAAPFSSDPCNS